MLAMENVTRYSRPLQPNLSLKHRRSGYEPSDTENEWQEIPSSNRPKTPTSSSRKHSKSPYKPPRGSDEGVSSMTNSNHRRSKSPFGDPENHIYENNEYKSSLQRRSQRTPPKSNTYFPEFAKGGEGSNYNHHRSMSAPKPRPKNNAVHEGRSPSPLDKGSNYRIRDGMFKRPTGSYEINEMIANMKLSKTPSANGVLPSTESISNGDIFFSKAYTSPQRDSSAKNNTYESSTQRNSALNTSIHRKNIAPELKTNSDSRSYQENKGSSNRYSQNHAVSVGSVLSHTNTSQTASHASNSKNSNGGGNDNSGKFGGSLRKITSNVRRSQSDTWFSCMKSRSCARSTSPDTRAMSEASFIEKAFVVEELRAFWADKYYPRSFSELICHKQQAQQLKQVISQSDLPHVIFRGPPGSGKKSLAKALLHEIFGDSSCSISNELRHFQVQGSRSNKIAVPVTSSPHHVELHLNSKLKNTRYALMTLVKEIAADHAARVEASEISFKADYKVILMYHVDKAEENVQHMIKWVMDCYTDICKIMLCCEIDTHILDSIKSRCKVVAVDAPETQEIIEVLNQIAMKEGIELPAKFAARIATYSKKNLRKAIMALEACKTYKYPFTDEQPVPIGWEEVLEELACDILADPSPKRLFLVRGKLQKLLVEFVHPKLILQKLVEEFLKGIETNLKREVYYWHAYYDKRLPEGTSALLKLEEFVAKFMSIQRKSISSPSSLSS